MIQIQIDEYPIWDTVTKVYMDALKGAEIEMQRLLSRSRRVSTRTYKLQNTNAIKLLSDY